MFYQGTPEEYQTQLEAAVDVAHSLGIKVTNGGMVSKLSAALAANYFVKNGKQEQAVELLEKTFTKNYLRILKDDKIDEQIEKGMRLMEVYKNVNIDFVNFHWYIPDAKAFSEVVAFFRRETGKQMIVNEMGQQKSVDPAEVEIMMNAVIEEKIPLAVWFSFDVPAFSQAKELADSNGNLRSNGIAFQDFILKCCK